MIVDLAENNIVVTKINKIQGENGISEEFNLDKYEESRKIRFTDSNKFQ